MLVEVTAATRCGTGEYSNVYPLMSVNPPAPFVGGINSKAVNLSLSGEGYLLKVGSFSFGSSVSASTAGKPIF